jgi:TolB-like protein
MRSDCRMRRATAAAAVVGMLAVGCRSAGTRYLHPNVDLAALKTAAVLPFENLTADRTAADKVQKIVVTELLALEVFEVVEPGTVVKAMRAERAESVEALGPAELQKVGAAVKADVLFLGAVVDFADNRSGSTPAPEVTVQLRMVETQSGVTVWSVSRTRSGAGAMARLFGIGGDSVTEAARQLVRDELRTLLQ